MTLLYWNPLANDPRSNCAILRFHLRLPKYGLDVHGAGPALRQKNLARRSNKSPPEESAKHGKWKRKRKRKIPILRQSRRDGPRQNETPRRYAIPLRCPPEKPMVNHNIETNSFQNFDQFVIGIPTFIRRLLDNTVKSVSNWNLMKITDVRP